MSALHNQRLAGEGARPTQSMIPLKPKPGLGGAPARVPAPDKNKIYEQPLVEPQDMQR